MAQQTRPSMVGADVDSRFIELFDFTTGQAIRIANESKAIQAWLRTLSAPVHLAMEATGRYHFELAELAYAHGLRVYVINPQWIAHYRSSVGGRIKTDACDAQLLARYVDREHAQLRPWTPPPAGQRQAWSLLKRRAKLVQARTMLGQSLGQESGLRGHYQAMLRRMDELERAIETQLMARIKQLGWGAALARCQSVYGIGPLSAAALVITYHRGPFRSADALVAFLGLDVRVRQSGRYVGRAKLTKQGDPECRRLLHNAARAAARGDLKPYYQRLIRRGLKSTQAHVAVARKLVRIAFSLIKSQQNYDPDKLKIA